MYWSAGMKLELGLWAHVHILPYSIIINKSPPMLPFRYAEVRAEQKREMGIEELPPKITVDKVSSIFWTAPNGG